MILIAIGAFWLLCAVAICIVAWHELRRPPVRGEPGADQPRRIARRPSFRAAPRWQRRHPL